jgi:hypothetical protein
MLGVLGGHAADYAVAFPSSTQRNEVLRATGHGWLSLGAGLAGLLAAVVISGVLARAVVPLVGRGRSSTSLIGFALRLAGWQVLIFTSLEFAERLLHRAPVADLTHGPLLATGISVQLPVAVLVAAAVALLQLFCARAQPLRRCAVAPAVITLPAGAPQRRPADVPRSARTTRGPPLGVHPA